MIVAYRSAGLRQMGVELYHVKMTRMPVTGVAATIRVESFPIVAVIHLRQVFARP